MAVSETWVELCGGWGMQTFRMFGFGSLVEAEQGSLALMAPDDSSESASALAGWLEVPLPRSSSDLPVAGRAGWLSMTRVVEAGSAGCPVVGEGVEDVF